MGNEEHHSLGPGIFQEPTALPDRVPRTHHVIEHNHIPAPDVLDGARGIGIYETRYGSLVPPALRNVKQAG